MQAEKEVHANFSSCIKNAMVLLMMVMMTLLKKNNMSSQGKSRPRKGQEWRPLSPFTADTALLSVSSGPVQSDGGVDLAPSQVHWHQAVSLQGGLWKLSSLELSLRPEATNVNLNLMQGKMTETSGTFFHFAGSQFLYLRSGIFDRSV